MYWEKELETIDRPALESLQLERLINSLRQAKNSPCYSSIPEVNRLANSGMTSITQLRELPFTTKDDLRQGFPWGFLSTDKKNVVRLHSSSGTTGNPTVVYHSQHDLESWANLMARSLFSAGVRDTDVFQNMSGYGQGFRTRTS